MRTLYFDCAGGISGAMALGALLDAGADEEIVRAGLASLPIEPFELTIESVETHGVHATRVGVRPAATGVVRTYTNVRALIDQTELTEEARALAQRIFRRIAEAEAAVHRRDVEQVALHEAGGADSIADITGTAIALSSLRVDRVFSSAVPMGVGMVKTEHGSITLPVPVVLELMRGALIYSRPIPFELTTTTGAAILAATVEGYGDLPILRADAVGYGAGAPRPDFPHVLRVLIGETAGDSVPVVPTSAPARPHVVAVPEDGPPGGA